MRIKKLLFLIFVFSITFVSASTSITGLTDLKPDELFEQANKAYSEGDFNLAYKKYKEIVNQGYQNEALYFNLGNAYYKSGEIPLAILFYEKALKLNPASEDAIINLKLSNQKIVDKIEPLPELNVVKWWKNLLFSKKADDWGWLAIQAMFIAMLMFVGFVIANNTLLKKAGFFCGVFLFAVSILFFVFGNQQKNFLNNQAYAIVFSPSLTVRSAPHNSGTKLFLIHEGAKVQVLDELSDWKKISIPNGSMGWVKSDAMEKI
ncbi:MAG: tetratricopeptide repeat protein [Bacteroidetes bacterium]|nr:tetratricopeptide repeat protein [Bacteroidota bacterium]HET6243666.1 tetratricopeptide repeat protein [Bacteroidia bacterium]